MVIGLPGETGHHAQTGLRAIAPLVTGHRVGIGLSGIGRRAVIVPMARSPWVTALPGVIVPREIGRRAEIGRLATAQRVTARSGRAHALMGRVRVARDAVAQVVMVQVVMVLVVMVLAAMVLDGAGQPAADPAASAASRAVHPVAVHAATGEFGRGHEHADCRRKVRRAKHQGPVV